MGDRTWKEFFSFGFVRNPYMRSLSTFDFLRYHICHKTDWAEQLRRVDHSAVEAMAKLSDFNDFVSSDIFRREHIFDGILRPQMHWVSDPDMPGKLAVEFVGKVENLVEDFNYCLRRIGATELIQQSAKLPQQNASKRESPMALLDERAAELIVRKYEADFVTFGYPVENPFK